MKSCRLASRFGVASVSVAGMIVILLLSACDNKQLVGALVGSQFGGYAGSKFGSGSERVLYTGLGAIAGASIGSQIGKKLDGLDEEKAQETQYEALEYSEPDRKTSKRSWENLKTGNSGEVVTGEVFEIAERKCREYTHTIYVDGKTETINGTACRNHDGTWSPS